MSRTSTLGGREARIYRSTFDDGLLDLFSGAGVLLIGVAWLFDLVAVGAVVPAMLIPLWPWAKRRLTEPRLGYLRFREERAAVERRKLGGLFVLGVLILMFAVLAFFLGRESMALSPANYVAALPTTLIALPAVVVSYVYGLRRFLVYAFVLVCAGAAVAVRDLDPGWALLGSGIVVLLAGVGLALRFVTTHPALEDGNDAAG